MEKSGLLLILKEENMTSHDCVNIVRRAFKTKKVGHTGTLDPMARGLLPICIGRATKTCELISIGDKEYEAEFTLGIRTDTLDITGEITDKAEPETNPEKIKETILSFLGESYQLPPMYSAKKINGKKLYELAREGKTIERTPAYINIKELEIKKADVLNNKFTIRVLCSKGTYIRSLIDDIGEKLGCFATMTSLLRTGCAGFTLSNENIITVSELKEECEDIYNKVIPLEEMLAPYPAVILGKDETEKFINGIRLSRKENPELIYRVLSSDNTLLALGKFYEEQGNFRLGVFKSFYSV